MATIEDMDDLIRQLREHPEWREALRREILTEELLSLPQIVRELATAQQRTEARLEALTAQVGNLTAQMGDLTTRVGDLTAKVGELTTQVGDLTTQVGDLTTAQQRTATRLAAVEGRLGTLDGRVFEQGYAAKAVSYFDDLLRKSRLLDWREVAELLDQAEGKISSEERKQVLAAALVLHGRRLDDQTETYLLAEVSVGIGLEDVQRATQRARILARATEQPVIPAVGGQEIIPKAQELASELEVSVFLDGGLRTD